MKYITNKQGQPINPYSWKSVIEKQLSEKNDKKVKLPSDAESMLIDPTYNFIAKMFDVNLRAEWHKNYQKIYLIVEYAKDRTGSDDLNHIVSILKEKLSASPQICASRLDDVVSNIKLELAMKNEKPKDHNGNKSEEVLEV